MRSATPFVCLITIWISMATEVRAQSATATLSGVVVDETGAVVPDVTVSALNRATGWQRLETTNAEGAFTMPLLPPGQYIVRAQRDGFTPLEVRDVALNVGDQLALRLQLKVAAVGESVTVVAEPRRVNTSPAVGTLIDRQFVENLPLNGRSFQSLIALTPGVILTKATFGEQGQFSVNGQRANANYFTVDGVSANVAISAGGPLGQTAGGALPSLSASGGTNNLVSIDALQEFKIQTSSYAPEFGRTPGAQVSVVTRSGTNDFHGTLFNYFRNEALDANDWFANNRGLKKTRPAAERLWRGPRWTNYEGPCVFLLLVRGFATLATADGHLNSTVGSVQAGRRGTAYILHESVSHPERYRIPERPR